ncbi:MAG: ATPase V [Spirochaetales bacterium]|nr:ATPase V [Spirochaetales bacterium]
MIMTTAMKQLSAVVMEQDMDKLTRCLLEKGVLDFISIKEISREMGEKLTQVEPRVSLEKFAEVRRRTEYLLSLASAELPAPRAEDLAELELSDPDRTDKKIRDIAGKVEAIREEQNRLQQEYLKTEEIRRQMELVNDLNSLARSESAYAFLKMRTGHMDPRNVPQLEKLLTEMPTALINAGEQPDFFMLISLKRDESRVTAALGQVGFAEGEGFRYNDYGKERLLKDLEEQMNAIKREQREKKEQVVELVRSEQERLVRLWQELRASELYYKVQNRFSRTARTFLFSGWLPAERKEELGKAILDVCENRCYLEWYEAEDARKEENLTPPVALKSPRALKPFQNLVTNYATPQYGTINPTPFVAVAYFLMFGLMFGDAGQGLAIFLIGLSGFLKTRREKKDPGTLIPLMMYCGISAFVFGLLFGSWFGFSWTPSLWFNYHDVVNGHASGGPVQSIMAILGLTLWFGLAVMEIGIAINCVNLANRKEWLYLFLDKGGLLGFWIIGAGFFIIRQFLASNMQSLPADIWIFLGLILPTALLFVKPVVEVLHHRKEHREGRGHGKAPGAIDAVMEGVVEILEVYAGYLSNVLSFMRVAGLGIAHVSLMTAFYSIAVMVSGGAGVSLVGIVVLILGNVLVTALEGLSAGIQSLRLNYYEFFAKFFKGRGRAYRPMALDSDW